MDAAQKDPEQVQLLLPQAIYLQPWCTGCDKHAYRGEGRMWCEDDVFENCEECGAQSVRYILNPAPLKPKE